MCCPQVDCEIQGNADLVEGMLFMDTVLLLCVLIVTKEVDKLPWLDFFAKGTNLNDEGDTLMT